MHYVLCIYHFGMLQACRLTSAMLEAFLYRCELYFSLARMANQQQSAMLALLWLDRDAAVWWQTVRHQHPTGTLAW